MQSEEEPAQTLISELKLQQPATPPPLLVCVCKCESVSSHMGV